MFGLRTKKQLTTKFSPFYLMFGTEARYPCEVPEDYKVDQLKIEEVVEEEVVSEGIERQDTIFNLVQKNIANVQKKYKSPKTPKPGKFKIGNKVLRLNTRSQQRKGGKLEPNWLGPYTIVAIHGKSADLHTNTSHTCQAKNPSFLSSTSFHSSPITSTSFHSSLITSTHFHSSLICHSIISTSSVSSPIMSSHFHSSLICHSITSSLCYFIYFCLITGTSVSYCPNTTHRFGARFLITHSQICFRCLEREEGQCAIVQNGGLQTFLC
ncbi:putative gypsy retrotransposon integrase-like protein 1-like [Triplophysa rosa]|uniref:Gypsy retrotransposon integrase-like protein 1-like n=1 Tax=Triplophysa rosa TaxID=992332 RepID=A0A9W7T4L1_TRIRA|nr:putative gypsy retrotransposon integrase-like protein 1-like [Triplophysa rosa]